MAEQETETETETESELVEGEGGGSKSKLLIILGAIVIVLAVGGYFAAPFVSNMISPPEDVETEAEEVKSEGKPALFASLQPPLVVNFRDSYGEAHFMQITLEVLAREQKVIDEVKNHAAVIRNSLILMYGNVDYDFVTTREGKEKMLADALSEIRKIVERETGETGVEAVFFSGLIIQ